MSARFPALSITGERRQARLRDARLLIVSDARRDRGDLEAFLATVGDASADAFILRDETATEDELRAAADVFRRVADRCGALFLVHGLPGLACQVGADGVQVGQRDVHPDHARTVCGPDLLIGRTCRSLDELDRAADEDVDLVEVGPVLDGLPDTRPLGAAVLAQVSRRAATPWFAFGGITAETAPAVLAAGARRLVAGRAVTDADDPTTVCWSLRRSLGAVHG